MGAARPRTNFQQSVSTCILLVTIAIIARSQVLRTERKAKQLVLACATFDNQGNLMVTPDGSLPSQKITNSYLEEVSEAEKCFLFPFCGQLMPTIAVLGGRL